MIVIDEKKEIDGGKNNNSDFFFCSQSCQNEFEEKSLFQCQKCEDTCLKKIRKDKNSLGYCPQCLEKDDAYDKFKTPQKNSEEKKLRPSGGNCSGEFCGGVREATDWKQGGSKNKWYCNFCWDNIFGTKENDDNENNDNLQSKIQQAIREIVAELNRKPKKWKKNFSLAENWKAYFENSPNLGELKKRKEELLKNIWTAREQEKQRLLRGKPKNKKKKSSRRKKK